MNFLTYYLLGIPFAFLMWVLFLYLCYKFENDAIKVADILACLIASLFSWFSFFIGICLVIVYFIYLIYQSDKMKPFKEFLDKPIIGGDLCK